MKRNEVRIFSLQTAYYERIYPARLVLAFFLKADYITSCKSIVLLLGLKLNRVWFIPNFIYLDKGVINVLLYVSRKISEMKLALNYNVIVWKMVIMAPLLPYRLCCMLQLTI